MSHKAISDELSDRAALHALGLLTADEASVFETHLAEGCPVCESELLAFRQAAALVSLSLAEARPSPQLREKLLAAIRTHTDVQVWKKWASVSQHELHVVRSTQGEWQPTGVEGVSVKQLYIDPARHEVTMLVRMAPGSTYPGHRHVGAEQCFVLEGDLRIGDLILHSRDYQCAPAESIHPPSSTEKGCLLLIVSSMRDELLT